MDHKDTCARPRVADTSVIANVAGMRRRSRMVRGIVIVTAWLCLALLAARLPTTHAGTVSPTGTNAPADIANTIADSDWVVFIAESPERERIAPFQRQGTQFALRFADGYLQVEGACSRFLAPYRIDADHLQVGGFLWPEQACSDDAKGSDRLLASSLGGRHRIGFGPDPRWRDLRLMHLDAGNRGTLTMYRGTRRSVAAPVAGYIEIAPALVRCRTPDAHGLPRQTGDQACMRIRGLAWNAEGWLVPSTDWAPWPGHIDGYRHREGQAQVLRVLRHTIEAPEIHGPTRFETMDMVMAPLQE